MGILVIRILTVTVQERRMWQLCTSRFLHQGRKNACISEDHSDGFQSLVVRRDGRNQLRCA